MSKIIRFSIPAHMAQDRITWCISFTINHNIILPDGLSAD